MRATLFSLQLDKMLHSCRDASKDGGKDGKIGCLDSNGKCTRGFPKEYAVATSIGAMVSRCTSGVRARAAWRLGGVATRWLRCALAAVRK